MIDNLPNIENKLDSDVIMSLVYIAGYIQRKDDTLGDTFCYFDKYGDYLKDLNRGGLTVPGDLICQWVIFSYISME